MELTNMKTWTTKDGKELHIKEIEDRHLLNILSLLETRAKNGVECSWRELNDTGYDGDSYVSDFTTTSSVLYGNDYLRHTLYTELLKEAVKRKIL